jgi:hypothetical protein
MPFYLGKMTILKGGSFPRFSGDRAALMQQAEDFPRRDGRGQVDHPGVQAWVRIAGPVSLIFKSFVLVLQTPYPQLSYGWPMPALRKLWTLGVGDLPGTKGERGLMLGSL